MKAAKKGINLEDVQELNRALVIRLLRKNRLCSRAKLASMTGLKQSTITNIINDFLEWNLVTEKGIIEGQKGRRSIGISLDSELYKVVGVRLARKYFSVGLFDLSGAGTTVIQEPLDAVEGPSRAFRRIRDAVEGVVARASRNRVLGVGMAVPGPFFRTEGKIGLMTEFPGWDHVALEQELRATLRVPVFLEHDANAGALAEWWLGPHSQETGTMIYVAAGQGIGAGIVIDGKLFRGTLGVAGEIGHMSIEYDGPRCECGHNGCLEHYCSTIALQREVKKALVAHPEHPLNEDHTLPAIFRSAAAADPLVMEEVRKAAWYLGFGLVNVVNTFNPDVIVIGDDLAEAGPLLLETVKETIQSHVLPGIFRNLKIELSAFPHDPVLIGVGTLVVEKVLQHPATIATLAATDDQRARAQEG
ncbi:MAG TPA: ROK family protein [Spirochaetia bacterium]|nr:ROK family protein [Spirochaetia bacterium]